MDSRQAGSLARPRNQAWICNLLATSIGIFSRDQTDNVMKSLGSALKKPALNLEELNLKYEGEKPAKYAYRARVPGAG